MQRSEQLHKLAAALAKAQGEIENADKDSTNPHFKSKYADLAAVRAAVRGPLSANGLAYMQFPRFASGMVEVETLLVHAESGQSVSDTLSIPVHPANAQTIGSAITYARRYSLMALAGIAPEDDDANAATEGSRDRSGAGYRATPSNSRKPEAPAAAIPFAEPPQSAVEETATSSQEEPVRNEAQALLDKPGRPSHIAAPAADPKALALKKQEEANKAAEAFRAESKKLADEWVGTLKSRLDQAKASANRQEMKAIRERHAAWIQTAQACWNKLIPADQQRVKRDRLALEDFLKDAALDELAEIAKEQAA